MVLFAAYTSILVPLALSHAVPPTTCTNGFWANWLGQLTLWWIDSKASTVGSFAAEFLLIKTCRLQSLGADSTL